MWIPWQGNDFESTYRHLSMRKRQGNLLGTPSESSYVNQAMGGA